ncbi:LOW QUALITY PROTEIN: alpha-1-antitrypsin-like protein CM55-ST [Thalassophryne amazonica]|uniref:LOW QUALITY PROTEIN: alpha-1-antitrypsin-like protein CM55-ST n=1 Tax=Thalassophryne amazonica TaxID=390379 RepID=UPI0014715B36|nr:LOW QUALITY PROTEIN: alpha-1-antitrypsin-like protein CM55-ST [Thalassophryne amazonica]
MIALKAELKSKKKNPGVSSWGVQMLEDEVEGHIDSVIYQPIDSVSKLQGIQFSAWLLSAVICVGRGQTNQDTADDSSTSSLSLVTEANKEFIFRLYKDVAAQPGSEGKNIFLSASVSMALAALSTGARGETHHQIFSGLGYNDSVLTQADVDQSFHSLLVKENKTSHEDISEGTAVFVDDHFMVRPQFVGDLKKFYLADVFTVDFSQTMDSANTINKYVANKTNGKIDSLVEDLDPLTVMYLLSYIYYKGKWATQFNAMLTKEDEFHVDANTKVEVQMMNMQNMFDIYIDGQTQTSVLRLLFSNSYSMLLLLPGDMEALGNIISPNIITAWLKQLKSSKLLDLKHASSDKLKPAWEEDLGSSISEDSWTSILRLVSSSSLCARHRLIQFKVVHRAHISKLKLSSMYPDVSPYCMRCKHVEASLIHMFWSCSCLNKFWREIFQTLSRVLDTHLSPDPLIALFGVAEGRANLNKNKQHILSFTSLLARQAVLLRWTDASPPTHTQWVADIMSCLKLEKIRFSLQQKEGKFEKVWRPFLKLFQSL